VARLTLACHQVHNRYGELVAQRAVKRNVRLSAREAEVLALIAAGKYKPDISQSLSIAESTVDTLLKRCFEKLGTSNRMTAVLKGIGSGIILP
jgi:ATP/maltotriose-dependent transcriptional regulator MalT